MYLFGLQYSKLCWLFGDVDMKGFISLVNIKHSKKDAFDSTYGHEGIQVDFTSLKLCSGLTRCCQTTGAILRVISCRL